MAKVGILSMQRIKNYGSFLQAYALKKIIEHLGHEVEFVDYHIEAPILNTEKKGIIGKIFSYIGGDSPFIQKIQYFFFKKNFSKNYVYLCISNVHNYNAQVDTLVIGSDEVFNCIQSNKNVGFSLELFGKNNNAKYLISYAASFGNTTLNKIEQYDKSKELADLLKKFNKISVRDDNSGLIVKEFTQVEPVYNLDPVLIYNYMNVCNEIHDLPGLKKKYLIVYAYSNRISKYESNIIRKFAKEKQLKIYAIGGTQRCADKFINCSPFEVLTYFKNAQYVVTDTFHGTIFSIINHKQFLTLVRKSDNNSYGNEEKLNDLLKRLDLTTRILSNVSNLVEQIDCLINYDNVEKIISVEREKAITYLNENIK